MKEPSQTHDAQEPVLPAVPVVEVEDSETLKQHMLINLMASMQMMSEHVGKFAVLMTTASEQIRTYEERRIADKQELQDQRNRDRRHDWYYRAAILVLVIGVIFVVRDNRQSFQILQRVTGTEAQAAQAASTQKIVKQIDCNDEENQRTTLEEQRRQGLPVIPIPESLECKALRLEREALEARAASNKSSSTTTAGR